MPQIVGVPAPAMAFRAFGKAGGRSFGAAVGKGSKGRAEQEN